MKAQKCILSEISPECKEQIAKKEKIKEESDRESLLEKCWTEEYKGASKKWLIRDCSTSLPKEPLCSTMRETYQYPDLGKEKMQEAMNIGKRRKLLLKKYHKEATAEILKGLEEPEELLDYCTEYDGNFKANGFCPDDRYYMKNLEQNKKFPLYSSSPISYYSFNQIEPSSNQNKTLNGLTKVTDFQNIFKRNSQFSTPISQSLHNYEM